MEIYLKKIAAWLGIAWVLTLAASSSFGSDIGGGVTNVIISNIAPSGNGFLDLKIVVPTNLMGQEICIALSSNPSNIFCTTSNTDLFITVPSGDTISVISEGCVSNYAFPPTQTIYLTPSSSNTTTTFMLLPPPTSSPTLQIIRKAQLVIITLEGGLPLYTYQLQYKDDLLSGSWSNLGQPVSIPANGGNVMFQDVVALTTPRFYRTYWVHCQ